jgi:beta-barrel assembly-enhancing protease
MRKEKDMKKKIVCLTLSFALVCYGYLPTLTVRADHRAATEQQAAPFSELLAQSYLALFEQAPQLNISQTTIEAARRQIEDEKKREEDALKQKEDLLEDQIDASQDELKELNRQAEQSVTVEERRHAIHCRIQGLRQELKETELALKTGLDNRYDNKLAKLKVLEEWPQQYAEAQRLLATNQAQQRKFGDFRDIGFRKGPWEGQEDDVRKGREAIEELKRQNLLPPEIEDKEVGQYVRKLAERIARHSDLRVPLNVTVLSSKEINAFALPGGFLYLNSGLLLKAEKESELAGVIAHELAHSAARHADRLMSRANIAGIIFQAAQIAALIFTGGIASIGTYYALQYGFYGLGLVLSLSLLGVSRDYEIEADILGAQYLWQAGYNTKGFISFFDRMAAEEGYVTGLSWFRTHPPFYERMEETYREITLLPAQAEAMDDSKQFREMKKRLAKIAKKMAERDRDAPTLRRVYDCEDVLTESRGN